MNITFKHRIMIPFLSIIGIVEFIVLNSIASINIALPSLSYFKYFFLFPEKRTPEADMPLAFSSRE